MYSYRTAILIRNIPTYYTFCTSRISNKRPSYTVCAYTVYGSLPQSINLNWPSPLIRVPHQFEGSMSMRLTHQHVFKIIVSFLWLYKDNLYNKGGLVKFRFPFRRPIIVSIVKRTPAVYLLCPCLYRLRVNLQFHNWPTLHTPNRIDDSMNHAWSRLICWLYAYFTTSNYAKLCDVCWIYNRKYWTISECVWELSYLCIINKRKTNSCDLWNSFRFSRVNDLFESSHMDIDGVNAEARAMM